jgi:hypothetical protein
MSRLLGISRGIILSEEKSWLLCVWGGGEREREREREMACQTNTFLSVRGVGNEANFFLKFDYGKST